MSPARKISRHACDGGNAVSQRVACSWKLAAPCVSLSEPFAQHALAPAQAPAADTAPGRHETQAVCMILPACMAAALRVTISWPASDSGALGTMKPKVFGSHTPASRGAGSAQNGTLELQIGAYCMTNAPRAATGESGGGMRSEEAQSRRLITARKSRRSSGCCSLNLQRTGPAVARGCRQQRSRCDPDAQPATFVPFRRAHLLSQPSRHRPT